MKVMFPLTVKIIYDKRSSDAPYVVYTPELDIASCGPTEEKAKKNLHEAVEIVLKEVKRKKKLGEFLEKVGFQRENKNWKPPRISFEPFIFSLSG